MFEIPAMNLESFYGGASYAIVAVVAVIGVKMVFDIFRAINSDDDDYRNDGDVRD